MPELPEIETTRRAVEPLVAGKTVESVDVRHPGVIAHPDAKIEGAFNGIIGENLKLD